MSFTFTRDIPAAGNNPSTDQPLMKQNYNATDDLLAIDHVSFNNATGGLHKQIHYVANQAAPGAGAGVGVEFVNSATGLLGTVSSLFFQNATTTQGLTNLPITTVGQNYGIRTPWGLILNFGFNAGAAANVSVTFAIAFSTSIYSVYMTAQSTDAARTVSVSPGPSLTGFTGVVKNPATGFWYLALGA